MYSDKWAEILANVDAFRSAASRLGFVDNWMSQLPIGLSIEPPAPEAEIEEVEAAIGEPLPSSLRRFFCEASSRFEIGWMMPGRMVETPQGFSCIDFAAVPPAPFNEPEAAWLGRNGPLQPTIMGGQVRIALVDTAGLLVRHRNVVAHWRREAMAAESDERRRRAASYADFWARGFPIAENDSDVFAVDRRDPEGRLLFLSGEGADEPGWFLERELIDFLLVSSRLGFVGFGALELVTFSEDGESGPMATRFAREHESEAAAGLALPTSVILDDRSERAGIWRRWLAGT